MAPALRAAALAIKDRREVGDSMVHEIVERSGVFANIFRRVHVRSLPRRGIETPDKASPF
jgi:hypothetical protein